MTAENVTVTVRSSSDFGLTQKQPAVVTKVKINGFANQAIKLVLQKEISSAWVDAISQDLLVESVASAVFQIAEKSPGVYRYKVLAKSKDGQTIYHESLPFKVQIDDLKQLTRTLFYGEQQACITSKTICTNYRISHNYPGLWKSSDLRVRMQRETLGASNPDLTTITPDFTWTLPRYPGDPKPLLEVKKPLPGETYSVSVVDSYSKVQSTVHVTYLDGKLYYYTF